MKFYLIAQYVDQSGFIQIDASEFPLSNEKELGLYNLQFLSYSKNGHPPFNLKWILVQDNLKKRYKKLNHLYVGTQTLQRDIIYTKGFVYDMKAWSDGAFLVQFSLRSMNHIEHIHILPALKKNPLYLA